MIRFTAKAWEGEAILIEEYKRIADPKFIISIKYPVLTGKGYANLGCSIAVPIDGMIGCKSFRCVFLVKERLFQPSIEIDGTAIGAIDIFRIAEIASAIYRGMPCIQGRKKYALLIEGEDYAFTNDWTTADALPHRGDASQGISQN